MRKAGCSDSGGAENVPRSCDRSCDRNVSYDTAGLGVEHTLLDTRAGRYVPSVESSSSCFNGLLCMTPQSLGDADLERLFPVSSEPVWRSGRWSSSMDFAGTVPFLALRRCKIAMTGSFGELLWMFDDSGSITSLRDSAVEPTREAVVLADVFLE